MNNSRIEYDEKALYELISVLTACDTTISGSVSLCEDLWQDSQNRIWLIAALMRKANMLTLESDQACLQFLADKVLEGLRFHGQEKLPAKEQLADLLPALIQLMPDEVWHHPVELWQQLLQAVKNELGLEIEVEDSTKPEPPGSKSVELALLFADAVGQAWSSELEKRLDTWKDSPEYNWLVALRDSAKLETLLDSTRKQASAAIPLNDPDLFEKFSTMKGFDRRRFFLIRNTATQETIWPEIEIDDIAMTIEWRFYFPLKQDSSIGLYSRDQLIAEMQICREAKDCVTVKRATGVWASLRSKQGEKIAATKAAAGEVGSLVTLTRMLKGTIQPLGDGLVLLILQWHNPQDKK